MISIVIPYLNRKEQDEKNLVRLTESIKDQDFKDYEIIIEEDIHKQGASITRNKGADKAKGDILFFIDADCMLQPGMLREIQNQFDDNKQVSFLYFNWRFFGEPVQDFYAQPFDAYLLETFNYISTMSPVKKSVFESVGGFRDLPYFQDWDLFYRIADAGHTGKWVEEFLFWTEKPDEDSISGIDIPLYEKCSEFRKWNDIPDKDLVVTTLGAPLQAIQRAKMLNADYVGPGLGNTKRELYPSQLNFPNWKATYLVGCFNERIEALEAHLNITVGKPIIHFIGTDVWHMYNAHPLSGIKEISSKFESLNAKIFANAPRLVDELKYCHIDAELLYTPVAGLDGYYNGPLPQDFTVACMISDTNPMHAENSDRSLIELVYDVARSMPTVKFKFFGSVKRGLDQNVEWCGKIDNMPEFIQSASMLLRATIHDGFPQSPIQFICSGRPALVTCPDDMPGAVKLSFEEFYSVGFVNAKKEIISKIYSIRDSIHKPLVNYKPVYSALMDREKFVRRVRECI